jgi:hypothetical protein
MTTTKPNYVQGERPTHIHTCVDAGEEHTWKCNSPYCESRVINCPEHGGLIPIMAGSREERGLSK